MSVTGSRSLAVKARKCLRRKRKKKKRKSPKRKNQEKKSRKKRKKEKKKAAPSEAEKEKPEAEERPPKVEKLEEARVKASPVARRIAAELGVDLSSVKGTGPEGRVTETDVRAVAKSVAGVADRGPAKAELEAAPSVEAGESARIQLSGLRKIIAQRLVESLGPIPHFY